MRLRVSLLLALLLPAVVQGQTLPPSPQGLTAQFSSTCAASTCATWIVGNATSVTVSVTGAGSWTGTFYASSDNGNTYFTATVIRLSDKSNTTTVTDTGDGQYAIVNSGITHLQFRLTSWASGGANVWAIRGYGSPMALPFSSGSPVPATSGGTGISSYAVGDLLTADTTTTLSKLADVAVGSVLISGGVGVVPSWSASPLVTAVNFGTSVLTNADAANTLSQRNGTNPQTFRVYNTYTSGSAYERVGLEWTANNFYIKSETAGGSGNARDITLYGGQAAGLHFVTNQSARWDIGASTGHLLAATDNTYTIGNGTGTLLRPSSLFLATPAITAAASVAAGGTMNNAGDHTRQRYQITIAPAGGDCSAAFILGATTADCTIATLPAGMQLSKVYADVTAGFTCSGTCSGTKVMQCGITGAGTEILAAARNVATTATYGLADADLGSAMTRAARIQDGYLPSWSATTPVVCRFTSGTGNWGNGSATFVNAGSVKITLITELAK